MKRPHPWKPADATIEIRAIARNERMRLTYREHARERLLERGLIQGDVLHVMKNGTVFADAEESRRPNLFKYQIEGLSPNSGGRIVRIVVIPESETLHLNVITVMWVTR